MNCQVCGGTSSEKAKHCQWCGTPFPDNDESSPEKKIPEKYRPLSMWEFVGYNFIFSIPLLGFILILITAIIHDNMNVRNYARSIICTIMIAISFIVICAALYFMIMQIREKY